MKKRVVVAMSGGVDSSVAAALLKEQGYEVVGITMCFGLSDSSRKKPACCGIQGIEDAQSVAHKLGIRHYTLNMQKALKGRVIDDFCRQYLLGRTPNPCIRCNQYLKFGVLLNHALALDAKFLATGHYARITKTQNYSLIKAKDLSKDQSYFLYRLGQAQLKHILFPLGNYLKSDVRKLAKELGLSVADKPGSQEVCFLPQAHYQDFLKQECKRNIKPGNIVDSKGNILGSHKGIAYYTIGQREGLGIAKGYPIYITKINARNNQITVGVKEECFKKEFLADNLHFVGVAIKKRVVQNVRIRYNHKEAKALLASFAKKMRIKFFEPQFALTPGQAAVFYDKDKVLGGGIIEKVLD